MAYGRMASPNGEGSISRGSSGCDVRGRESCSGDLRPLRSANFANGHPSPIPGSTGPSWIAFLLILLAVFPAGPALANFLTVDSSSQTPGNPLQACQPVTYALNLTNNVDTDPRDTIGVTIRLFLDGQVVDATQNQTTQAFTVTGCTAPDPEFPDAFLCPNLAGTGSTLAPTFTWNNPTQGDHILRFDVYWRRLPTSLPFGTPDGIISPTFQTSVIPPTVPPTASLQATDSSASEAGLDPGTFRINLNAPAPSDLFVPFALTGTAGYNLDYTLSGKADGDSAYGELSDTLFIPACKSGFTIIADPIADTLAEGLETIVTTLEPGDGYQVGAQNNATVTIADVTASILAPAADAAEDAPDARRFTVYLDGPAPAGGITINYTRAGTAVAGDYTLTPSGSVTIPEGQTRAFIDLTPIADDFVEGRETVELSLLQGANYGVGNLGKATLAIADKTAPGEPWKVLQLVASEQDDNLWKDHACALLSNGIVKCWGANDEGQLGLGDTTPRGGQATDMGNNLPAVNLGTGRRAVELAAGKGSVCAILDNGDLKCWGNNGNGQLGQGDTANRGDAPGEMGDNLPPVNLGAGRRAVQLAMGSGHSCALLDDGAVKCWGLNENGQLGLGNTQDTSIPTNPVGFGDGPQAVEIAAMRESTCARLSDGSVTCWGRNHLGQLGLENTVELTAPDGSVDLGTGMRAAKLSGLQHGLCTRLVSGDTKCWGHNQYGVLGLGLADSSINNNTNRGDAPREMGDFLPVVDLGSGRQATQFSSRVYHSCALLDNGTVKCFGSNFFAELGLGDAAKDPTDPNYDLTKNRGNAPGEMGDALPAVNLGTSPPAVREVVAGAWMSCARFDDGRVKCWGNNAFGQLGLGDTLNRGDEPGEMGDALPFLDLGGPIRATLQATDATAAELGPDPGEFTVSLSSRAPNDLVVAYTVSGTATNGVDYQTLSGSVTIPQGQMSASIPVIPIPDALVEGTETVIVTLATGDGYVPGQPDTATVTIADAPIVPVLPVAALQATGADAAEEGPDPGAFTICLNSPASNDLVVVYTVSGTATNGVDYQPLSGSVTIPRGQMCAPIPVIPIPDTRVEGAETVVITLVDTGAGYQVGQPASATVTIADAPIVPVLPAVSIAATDPVATEKGRGPGAFTFSLNQPAPAGGLAVAYSVAGTAASGRDYVPLSGTVSIPAGESSIRLPLRVKNDPWKEGRETVVLTLQPAAGYQLGSPLSATVTIEDNDTRRPPPNQCEASQLEEAVILNRQMAACVRTNLRTHDDEAYSACRGAAESAFAGRFDAVLADFEGCRLTLPGPEVAGLWGDLLGAVHDPLVADWHIQPSPDFRPASRSRRFTTVSKVVERSVKGALRAEIRFLLEGDGAQRQQTRADVRTNLIQRIGNLAADRPDYTGPRAAQFVSRVDTAVNTMARQVVTTVQPSAP